MSSAPSVQYLFPRSDAEVQRLNRQHQAILRTCGCFAHPSLGDLSQFRIILDSACGTAAWANDILAGDAMGAVAKLSDNVVVEGSDISDRLFPDNAERHPKLGELYVHDIRQPFPPQKRERYDLINQRLLAAALNREEWPVALGHLFSALKPGGYLSALELDIGVFRKGMKLEEEPRCMQICTQAVWTAFDKANKSRTAASDLPDAMRRCGFVDVQAHPFKLWMGGPADTSEFGADHANFTYENLVSAMKGLLPMAVKLGGCEGCRTTEEAQAVIEETSVEYRREVVYQDMVIVVGRKPT